MTKLFGQVLAQAEQKGLISAGRCTSTGTGALVSRHRILIAELTREPCNPTAVAE